MDQEAKVVLIVDDDRNMREIFNKYLTSMGFRTILANDGNEALEILATGPLVDLIITDVMMPFVDGFHLTKTLRESMETRHIPIIGTSAFHSWKTAKEGGELNVDAFIPKPIVRDVLFAAVIKAMSGGIGKK